MTPYGFQKRPKCYYCREWGGYGPLAAFLQHLSIIYYADRQFPTPVCGVYYADPSTRTGRSKQTQVGARIAVNSNTYEICGEFKPLHLLTPLAPFASLQVYKEHQTYACSRTSATDAMLTIVTKQFCLRIVLESSDHSTSGGADLHPAYPYTARLGPGGVGGRGGVQVHTFQG